MTARLTIEYDGKNFRGWAKQPGQRTVEDELEKALAVILREPTKLTVAGRTDAGVHAWGQVASHPGSAASARSLNALLPDDVTVLESTEVEEDFDARQHARSRTYCYRVWNRSERPALLRDRVLWFPYALDHELLNDCAETLVGINDFEAFTLSDEPYRSYRRQIIRAEWVQRPRLTEFWIEGQSFTRRMVRSLVSYQLDVARGSRDLERFRELLGGAPREQGGATAASCGLYLASVSFT